jgi:anti-sigma factor RsiW
MRCPMKSREQAELLLSYSSGSLAAEEAAAVSRHLETCVECRQVVEGQRRVWSALEEWEAPAVSAEFDRRLYAKIEMAERKAWWRSPAWLRPAVSVGLATVVAVVLLVRGPSVRTAPTKARAESVDIEQVEQTLEDMEMLKQLYATPSTEPARPRS